MCRNAWGREHDNIIELIEDARTSFRTDKEENAIYIEGLERGIALHHSGLPRRYRTAVETLFRIGFLRIIFSTETLAVGINMPCKSTVFIGDSLQLNTLMYRQTSGRAGRRGFDTFGHIIFWEIPFLKIKRLLCASLPVLCGEFPVTPTAILRSFQLLNVIRSKHVNAQELLIDNKQKCEDLKSLHSAEISALESSLVRMFQVPLFSIKNIKEINVQDSVQLNLAIKYAFR